MAVLYLFVAQILLKMKQITGDLSIKYLKPNSKKGFSFLAGINRPVNPDHVNKLAASVRKMDNRRPVLVAKISFITGKPETYIIDGQHLYTVLLKLGVKIAYSALEIKNKRDLVEQIAMLNNSSKSWSMLDYVTAWASIEPDYVKLNSYREKYNFEFSILASVLAGKIGVFGGKINQLVKRGEFKVVNEYHAVKLLNWMTDVMSVLPNASRYETKYICAEFLTFVTNCPDYKDEHQNFIKALKKNKRCLSIATQAEGKLSEIFKSLLDGEPKKNQRKKALRRAA